MFGEAVKEDGTARLHGHRRYEVFTELPGDFKAVGGQSFAVTAWNHTEASVFLGRIGNCDPDAQNVSFIGVGRDHPLILMPRSGL